MRGGTHFGDFAPLCSKLCEESYEAQKESRTKEHVWEQNVLDPEWLQFRFTTLLFRYQVFWPEKYYLGGWAKQKRAYHLLNLFVFEVCNDSTFKHCKYILADLKAIRNT